MTIGIPVAGGFPRRRRGSPWRSRRLCLSGRLICMTPLPGTGENYFHGSLRIGWQFLEKMVPGGKWLFDGPQECSSECREVSQLSLEPSSSGASSSITPDQTANHFSPSSSSSFLFHPMIFAARPPARRPGRPGLSPVAGIGPGQAAPRRPGRVRPRLRPRRPHHQLMRLPIKVGVFVTVALDRLAAADDKGLNLRPTLQKHDPLGRDVQIIAFSASRI